MTGKQIESALIQALEQWRDYNYSQEAEADAIGEPGLKACVEYHGAEAKWAEESLLRFKKKV